MNEPRIYSVEEANALLPYLAPTLVELREKYEEAARIKDKMTAAANTNGWSASRDRWAEMLARVGELAERVTEWGIELRDVSTGLVDFPGIVEGELVWLCWRLGEPEVAYWHPRDEGFAGRRPL